MRTVAATNTSRPTNPIFQKADLPLTQVKITVTWSAELKDRGRWGVEAQI